MGEIYRTLRDNHFFPFSSTRMKDRIDVRDLDKLSMYDQDDLLQLIFVAGETIAELESQNHFLH
jgi:hypothetical protein